MRCRKCALEMGIKNTVRIKGGYAKRRYLVCKNCGHKDRSGEAYEDDYKPRPTKQAEK